MPEDVSDFIRTVILLGGVTLAMLCVKFAYIALRNGEGYRAWGLASYALLAVTPAFIGLHRYEEPIVVTTAIFYTSGIVCGFLALRAVITITPEWSRLRAADRKRKREAHNDD